MKKKGNICEFIAERDADLMSNFRRCLGRAELVNLDTIFGEVAMMPARRFYVSEFRAVAVIKNHLRSGVWSVKGVQRVRMFEEIERRTLLQIRQNPAIRLDDAVFEAVNSPAPCFYLTPRSCRTILYKYMANR